VCLSGNILKHWDHFRFDGYGPFRKRWLHVDERQSGSLQPQKFRYARRITIVE
jgi:hypothetical protein